MTEPITTENLLLYPPADPDPRCPDECEACAGLSHGGSVRAEQRAMMVRAIRAEAVYERILTTTAATPPEQRELFDMAFGARIYGHVLASVIGMLLAKAPDLAHEAVAIHQDMCTDGGVWHTEELYAEIEAANAAKAAEAAGTSHA